MSSDRTVEVKDMRNTKMCPNLFCNINLRNISNKELYNTSLSKKEAEKVLEGLTRLLK